MNYHDFYNFKIKFYQFINYRFFFISYCFIAYAFAFFRTSFLKIPENTDNTSFKETPSEDPYKIFRP